MTIIIEDSGLFSSFQVFKILDAKAMNIWGLFVVVL